MINQAICINGLENHVLCLMQCHLNDVHINDISKFLAEIPSLPPHSKWLTDPFNAAFVLIIGLQLSRVTSYFDVYSPSIAKYENEEIPKIHLTAGEHPWEQSTKEYSERET